MLKFLGSAEHLLLALNVGSPPCRWRQTGLLADIEKTARMTHSDIALADPARGNGYRVVDTTHRPVASISHAPWRGVTTPLVIHIRVISIGCRPAPSHIKSTRVAVERPEKLGPLHNEALRAARPRVRHTK
jgi:hypothetical protein